MKNSLNIIALIIMLIMTDCKKEQKYYALPQDFLEWVYFKNGSYWIYLNEKVGTSDSCYILYYPMIASLINEPYNYKYDGISTGFISSFLQGSLIVSTPDFSYADFFTQKGGRSLSIRTDTYIGQQVEFLDALYEKVAVFDTLTLNNTIYRNVIYTRVAFPSSYTKSSHDSIIRKYYFAKNVGLIKYEIQESNTDSTWSLMRYNIIQ